eukprot:9485574-Alexandrium_andersonii.AAC.1
MTKPELGGSGLQAVEALGPRARGPRAAGCPARAPQAFGVPQAPQGRCRTAQRIPSVEVDGPRAGGR